MKAIDNYDVNHESNATFNTYCYWHIRSNIRNQFRQIAKGNTDKNKESVFFSSINETNEEGLSLLDSLSFDEDPTEDIEKEEEILATIQAVLPKRID